MIVLEWHGILILCLIILCLAFPFILIGMVVVAQLAQKPDPPADQSSLFVRIRGLWFGLTRLSWIAKYQAAFRDDELDVVEGYNNYMNGVPRETKENEMNQVGDIVYHPESKKYWVVMSATLETFVCMQKELIMHEYRHNPEMFDYGVSRETLTGWQGKNIELDQLNLNNVITICNAVTDNINLFFDEKGHHVSHKE